MHTSRRAIEGEIEIFRMDRRSRIGEQGNQVLQCEIGRLWRAIGMRKSEIAFITLGCSIFINQFVEVSALNAVEQLFEYEAGNVFAFEMFREAIMSSVGVVSGLRCHDGFIRPDRSREFYVVSYAAVAVRAPSLCTGISSRKIVV